MRTSTIAATVTVLTAAYASPLSRRQSPEISHCANASNSTLCIDTVNAINGWDNSVNGVNNFLNVAGTSAQPALTDIQTLIDAEPGFLGILGSTSGLSQAGQDAVTFLTANFGPKVKDEFDGVVAGTTGVHDGVTEINSARCGSDGILENIGTVWVEAAAAAGADVPGRPLGPTVCEKEPVNSGDAYTTDS